MASLAGPACQEALMQHATKSSKCNNALLETFWPAIVSLLSLTAPNAALRRAADQNWTTQQQHQDSHCKSARRTSSKRHVSWLRNLARNSFANLAFNRRLYAGGQADLACSVTDPTHHD